MAGGNDPSDDVNQESFGRDQSPDDLFVPDDIFPADLAIVFGMTAWQRPLARATELYRTGIARKLLFTGGFNQHIQASEATEMARAAIAGGIPSGDIIVEAEATNTAANVANAYSCIEQSIGVDNLRSMPPAPARRATSRRS